MGKILGRRYSQTFEEALAHLILSDRIGRKEGLAYADAHQPHVAPAERLLHRRQGRGPSRRRASRPGGRPSFTEIVLDVSPFEAPHLPADALSHCC